MSCLNPCFYFEEFCLYVEMYVAIVVSGQHKENGETKANINVSEGFLKGT